ncbi:NAD(+)/NADH kinase [Stakelama sp. CBK3Z-3]|uniref:NAD(+)/NADH kinase n=1 Tax=Stakelama flava TaxID=2860338 RepID=A0ABS6XM50_9SPHN|nr:diacylglycerol kinase family protein [Stakelama flava]MBW4331295.1 NAD(+)/NADH kinase [Stakelama flava]
MRAGLTGRADIMRREPVSRRGDSAALARLPRLRDVSRPMERPLRIAMISNPRSHRNGKDCRPDEIADHEIMTAAPDTRVALELALGDFAARRVDVIIINGGDGTVRDVITAARRVYAGPLPKFAILPSGKTNAIAIDLGVSSDITLPALVEVIRAGKVRERAPLEISRDGSDMPELSGFLFGAGAFVKATALAQHTHRFGAFDGLAVALSLFASIGQTMFGSKQRGWRAGDEMTIAGDADMHGSFYLLLCSTLDRLPLRLKPFGGLGDGMKLLAIDAPPRQMIRRVPMLLAGVRNAAMERAGYRHRAAGQLNIRLDGDFILDGETYPGGDLTLRRGAPLRFVVTG